MTLSQRNKTKENMQAGEECLVCGLSVKSWEGNMEESRGGGWARIGLCLSYSSISVRRHHDRGNLQTKELIKGLLFQRLGSHGYHRGEHGLTQAGIVLEQ